jgi:hypothetical protein
LATYRTKNEPSGVIKRHLEFRWINFVNSANGLCQWLILVDYYHPVIASGHIEISQAKAAYGHWRTKMQSKSDPALHYSKSPANLPAYLSSQLQALNPTTLILMKPCIDILLTEPVGCILVVTQLINPANATAPGPPVIMLVATPSMANIGLQSKEDSLGILYEGLWDSLVLEPLESFQNPEEPHCPVLAASEGFSRSVASPLPQLYL